MKCCCNRDVTNTAGAASVFFNPRHRMLSVDGVSVRLRKKESEVLSLLCDKYPDPVTHDDFFKHIWRGQVVTVQSIAQSIRSLRVITGDHNRDIITTIPKLGYQLSVELTVM